MKKLLFLIAVTTMFSLAACAEKEGELPKFVKPEKVDPRDDPDPIIKKITTQVIAHRGHWKAAGGKNSENTIRAFLKADELNVYGAEFDLHLTLDGVVVAAHDPTVTIGGASIQINDKPYSFFNGKKLDNGEILPTLEDFLKAAKNENKNSIKLIIELKPQHTTDFNKPLTEKTVAMVKEMGMKNRVEYISFAEEIVKLIHKLDPTAPNAYLFQFTPMPNVDKLKSIGATCLDSDYRKTTEADIKNVLDGGLKMNVWTINSKDEMREFVGYGVDYITTDDPEGAIEIIEAMKRGK